MKNLLIYINPSESFDAESSKLVRIQIENSLELGWKPEDILLVTNFPYEYQGVKAFEISGEHYCKLFRQATKVDVMVHLFDIDFIKDNELYWLHDLDAYQQEWITEEELGLENVDIGLTDYGRKDRWNGGSIFLKKSIGDFYHLLKDTMYAENENNKGVWKNEEDVMMKLTNENSELNKRIKRLNITYNFGVRKIELCYDKAIKPVKVLHFHPDRVYWGKTTAWDIIALGKNELRKPLMSQRLIKIFNKYGYA